MISILGSQPLPTLEIGPPPQASMERLAYITELSQHLANAPSLLLNSLHPVFPLRGFEEWGYPVPDNAANSLDRVTLADRAIALTSILGYNRDLGRNCLNVSKISSVSELNSNFYPPREEPSGPVAQRDALGSLCLRMKVPVRTKCLLFWSRSALHVQMKRPCCPSPRRNANSSLCC